MFSHKHQQKLIKTYIDSRRTELLRIYQENIKRMNQMKEFERPMRKPSEDSRRMTIDEDLNWELPNVKDDIYENLYEDESQTVSQKASQDAFQDAFQKASQNVPQNSLTNPLLDRVNEDIQQTFNDNAFDNENDWSV